MPEPRHDARSNSAVLHAFSRLQLDDHVRRSFRPTMPSLRPLCGSDGSNNNNNSNSNSSFVCADSLLGPPPTMPPTLSTHSVCPCHGPSTSRFKEMRLRLQAPRRPTLQRQHAVLNVRDLDLGPPGAAERSSSVLGYRLIRDRTLCRSTRQANDDDVVGDDDDSDDTRPTREITRLSVVAAAAQRRHCFRGPY
ncbi:hypothetical protein PINS_up011558 [Pythium insidiosum]|nr:hypothetical protein PINS_up011558 [Pythium insidiosum]